MTISIVQTFAPAAVGQLHAVPVALADFPSAVVPVLFGAMGFASGIAGLDIGQAAAPLIFGSLMDHGHHRAVILGLALVQGVLIASAFNMRRVRREALPLPAAG